MENEELEGLKYPIGHYEIPEDITDAQIVKWIGSLESLPRRLRKLVENLSEEKLEMPYRPGGWTVRQTLHHYR